MQLLPLQSQRLFTVVRAAGAVQAVDSGIRAVYLHVQQACDSTSLLREVWLYAVRVRQGPRRCADRGNQRALPGGYRVGVREESAGRRTFVLAKDGNWWDRKIMIQAPLRTDE